MTACDPAMIRAVDTPPLVVQRLQGMAAAHPDKVLYTHLLFDNNDPVRVTCAQAWERTCAIAHLLDERNLRGQTVLLLYAPGQDFAPALFGSLLAGAIAVPVPVPQFAAQFERLGRIVADCGPGAILCTSDLAAKLPAKLSGDSPLHGCLWLPTDAAHPAASFEPAFAQPSDIALLQYTSGSTSEPKGVILSHANIAHNLEMLAQALQPKPGARIVSWLPHFHDMGLITGIIGPLGCDGESILMAPQTFLRRPLRWLQAISDFRAEISCAPNFAYDLCVRWADSDKTASLDLSCWASAAAGSEPIRMATLDAFADRFRDCGFRYTALTPCYGMAETTLLVTIKRKDTAPTTHKLSRGDAQRGFAKPVRDGPALTLAGCGQMAAGTRLCIVDPQLRVALPCDRIGEIWIAGPQVARGYWQQEKSDGPFGAALAGAHEQVWLRTGDLGYLTPDGDLVFVDRIKDLIIVNGLNHACHDLELTAAASHALLSADSCVAVSIEAESKAHIAIVAELPLNKVDSAEQAMAAIRGSVFSEHSLVVQSIAFVPPGNLSRTTSGKLQRRLTARRLSEGRLRVLAYYGDPVPVLSANPSLEMTSHERTQCH